MNFESLEKICRDVGVDPLQVNEVFRRINEAVIERDAIVITQTIGTFYRRNSKATVRTLNGERYSIPERKSVALRGPRFPGRQVDRFRIETTLSPAQIIDGHDLTIITGSEINFTQEFITRNREPLANDLRVRMRVTGGLQASEEFPGDLAFFGNVDTEILGVEIAEDRNTLDFDLTSNIFSLPFKPLPPTPQVQRIDFPFSFSTELKLFSIQRTPFFVFRLGFLQMRVRISEFRTRQVGFPFSLLMSFEEVENLP